jgi:plastocyanin
VFLIAGIFLLGSCSKSSSYSNPTSSGTKPTAAASVTKEDFAYSPAVVHVLPGGTVTWTNKDATVHTVTDDGGSFDSSGIAVDGTFKRTFATAGTCTYHCSIHSMMPSATVVVGN